VLLPKGTPENQETPKQAFAPDPRGVAFTKLMLSNDFLGYVDGRKTINEKEWSKLVPIAERVTARQLIAIYDDNEVAADEKFKEKSIRLTGTISKISKDITGAVYLEITTGAIFRTVQAFLANESAAQAGGFPRGSEIELICTGGGMILTFPVLRNCQTKEVVFALQRPVIEHEVDDLLAGGDAKRSDKTKFLIGYLYAIGATLPKGNACESAEPTDMEKCENATKKLLASGKSSVTAAYANLSKQISLPPFPARL
jgi:hypothetical protein